MTMIWLSNDLYDRIIKAGEKPSEFVAKAVREKLEGVVVKGSE